MVYIARGLISIIFLFAGVGKLFNWRVALDGVMMTFSKWYSHLEGHGVSAGVHEFLLDSSGIILAIAVALEIVGGVFLLIGFKPRIGALLLLIFLIPTTLLFHTFWFEHGSELQKELGVFLKNWAVIGGLLYIFLFPQVDKRKK